AMDVLAGGCLPRDDCAGDAAREPASALGLARRAVRTRDRSCTNADEEFVVLGNGPLDLLDVEHLGRSVSVVDDGLHRLILCMAASAPDQNHRHCGEPS